MSSYRSHFGHEYTHQISYSVQQNTDLNDTDKKTVFSVNENHIKRLSLLSTVFILRIWDMIYIKLLTGSITEGGGEEEHNAT